MLHCYTPKIFRPQSEMLIHHANVIIEEYMASGLRLTLRQLYYQFVARDLFLESYRNKEGTKNNLKSYKKLTMLMSEARLAGLIDWNAIEDRTRNLVANSHWDNPGEIIEAATQQYRTDKWADQEYRPEVWIEKEALAGVIEPICQELDVSFLACRGYMSQSEMWASAQRMLRNHEELNQVPVIIHLGDHDPSGIDMTRDIEDRMYVFNCEMVEIQRIALNLDQIEKFNPPPNPAKTTDSRFRGYIVIYGEDSWELDAIDPKTLVALIEAEVAKWRDDIKYSEQVAKENEQKEKLSNLVKDIHWE